MTSIWWISAISVAYIGLLFVIALKGDRSQSTRWQPYVYSLTLAIFCTTWAFYGTVLQTQTTGWLLAPTYLGAIIVVTLGWKMLARIIAVAKEENSTTIADFIATRFGHSRRIAVLVSIMSLFGVVPYIALQLKAVSGSFQLITSSTEITLSWYNDPTLVIAVGMAVFSILFGTRSIDASEHHRGLMLAIAFESIVKLIAFVAVGIYAVYVIRNGLGDVFQQAMATPKFNSVLTDYSTPIVYLTHALIGGIAIFALPRQFHAAVVEYDRPDDLQTARWLFPLYLLLINFFILPIALVGGLWFANANDFQTQYMTLWIPQATGADGLALLAYIGGLSAGTSMVIIASVALATMLSNEILFPLFIRMGWIAVDSVRGLSQQILLLRRISIGAILVFSYLYYRLLAEFDALADIGLLSFVAVSQFAPAMLIGLIWRGANRTGAMAGMVAGFVVWFFTLLVPVFVNAGWLPVTVMDGIFGLAFLKPHAFLGFEGLDPIVHGTFWSLLFNVTAMVVGSLYHKETFEDQEQAMKFVSMPLVQGKPNERTFQVKAGDLKSLLLRFVSDVKVEALFYKTTNPLTGRLMEDRPVDDEMLKSADRLLSSLLGGPAAELLLENFLRGQSDRFKNLNIIMDEASQVLHFNRELLSSALQSINQGISIVDRDMTIVAWNNKFRDLYDFPEDMLRMGVPIERLVRFIAEQGGYGPGSVEPLVAARMSELRSGTPHRTVRASSNGTFMEVQGNPMPDGRYITTYTDITEQRRYEEQLRLANERLEQRVSARTSELTYLNEELKRANKNKTRFLAAAGHDLVQPLNSATLFVSSLMHKLKKDSLPHEFVGLANNIEQSLESAENLLSELLEISKLDAEIVTPDIQSFPINRLLQHLAAEFQPIAEKRNLALSTVHSELHVKSDPVLLRRAIQNFLSNAIRYTPSGKITMGVRRQGEHLWVEVRDTGIGIDEGQQAEIFDEFHRVEATEQEKGLGLGLSIVKRICLLLDHPVEVDSELGKGSCFRVKIPLAKAVIKHIVKNKEVEQPEQKTDHLILCIDNESQIIQGMESLLSDWGYDVAVGTNEAAGLDQLAGKIPDCVVIDYHLDDNQTGVEAMKRLKERWQRDVPCLVITADYTHEVEEEILRAGFEMLKKPVKPLALRSLLNRFVS